MCIHRFFLYFCIYISHFDSQRDLQGKKEKILKRPEAFTVTKRNQIVSGKKKKKPHQFGMEIKTWETSAPNTSEYLPSVELMHVWEPVFSVLVILEF
jgi:hypothetical protein